MGFSSCFHGCCGSGERILSISLSLAGIPGIKALRKVAIPGFFVAVRARRVLIPTPHLSTFVLK